MRVRACLTRIVDLLHEAETETNINTISNTLTNVRLDFNVDKIKHIIKRNHVN